MTEGLTIRVRGGGALSVPRSASYLSTYVLLEQEDWFEKEIAFVRRVLQPGMRAIDVGANFGCYSVAIGRAVGPAGALWLYEPTSTTFGHLRRTLDSNELAWAHAHRLALSDHEGTGMLSVGDNSELNSLGQESSGDARETVQLTTLDRARVTHSIDSVDFVKLDAEGEEVRIVAGGQEFFRSEDPLVMFEVKHGTTINLALPSAFEQLGYRLYRLVGPDALLVPTAADQQLDGYELNLFACKAGRAARLEASGCLIDTVATMDEPRLGEGFELWRAQPFAAAFGAGVSTRDPLYARALDHYAIWRDSTRAPAVRHAALDAALRGLVELAERATTLPRLFTLVRIAREAGARSIAVRGLQSIIQALNEGRHNLDEPCWPALERYDSLVPNGGVGDWLTASAAEALVVSSHFSGYFSGPTALSVLDWLHACAFASAPMERRRELQGIFAGRQQHVEGSVLLQQPAEDNLNPQLWMAGTTILRGTA
jgi:FkbM family methyltransferase